MKTLLTLLLFTFGLYADYWSDISMITPEIRARMIKGNSYKEGCPVPLGNLRYLKITFKNFDAEEFQGELIVHKDVAEETVKLFEGFYEAGYPIRQMRLVSDYHGNDWQSIEADNTSAFNCRNATGSKKWSRHSYGKAIDINPLENPYVFTSGHISHKASLAYKKRVHRTHSSADKAVLLPSDIVVKLFKKQGWQWGGEWYGAKDYQHFQK